MNRRAEGRRRSRQQRGSETGRREVRYAAAASPPPAVEIAVRLRRLMLPRQPRRIAGGIQRQTACRARHAKCKQRNVQATEECRGAAEKGVAALQRGGKRRGAQMRFVQRMACRRRDASIVARLRCCPRSASARTPASSTGAACLPSCNARPGGRYGRYAPTVSQE